MPRDRVGSSSGDRSPDRLGTDPEGHAEAAGILAEIRRPVVARGYLEEQGLEQ